MSTPTREEYDAKLNASEAGTNTRLTSIEKTIENGFAKGQAEMQREIASQTKWVSGLILTSVSLGIAAGTFISHAYRPSQATPAPIVVVVPAAALNPQAATPAPAPKS